jgi:hypothetical protein
VEPLLHPGHLEPNAALGIGDLAGEQPVNALDGRQVVGAEVDEDGRWLAEAGQLLEGRPVHLPGSGLVEPLVVGLDQVCGVEQTVLGRQDLDAEAGRPAVLVQEGPQDAEVHAVVQIKGWEPARGSTLAVGAPHNQQVAC